MPPPAPATPPGPPFLDCHTGPTSQPTCAVASMVPAAMRAVARPTGSDILSSPSARLAPSVATGASALRMPMKATERPRYAALPRKREAAKQAATSACWRGLVPREVRGLSRTSPRRPMAQPGAWEEVIPGGGACLRYVLVKAGRCPRAQVVPGHQLYRRGAMDSLCCNRYPSGLWCRLDGAHRLPGASYPRVSLCVPPYLRATPLTTSGSVLLPAPALENWPMAVSAKG